MKEKSKKQDPRAEIAPELVALAKAGDQSAFTELYEQTNPILYRSIRAMVHDEDLAWDILQDSYLRAFRSLDKLEADEAFLVWLRRIAVNETARQMSKRAPLPFTELENGEEESLPELPDMNAEHQPELALDRQETSRLVREILSELTEQQQLVVGMRYYEEMSVTEIAQLLQVAPGTVKAQLFKGRKKVETRVRALETQGVKLYGMSPIPFLVALLRRLEPTREAEKKGLAVLLSQLPAAASTVTALTAGQALLHSLTGKLLVGLLALALLGGGIATGGKLFKDAIARIGDFQFTDTQYLASSEDPYASSEIRVAVSETEPGESDPSRLPQPENDDPTEPSDSRNPSEPTEPSDSQNPSEPTEPSEAPNPSENPSPSEPGPTQPPTPGGPTTPSDPPAPSESQNPTDPTIPTAPQESDTPSPPPTTEPTEPITEHTEPTTEHTEPTTDPTDPPVTLLSGAYGYNNSIHWRLDLESGELKLWGNPGQINNTSNSTISDIPWSPYRSSVQTVTVSSRVYNFGYYAFKDCTNLRSVTLPNSLNYIERSVFQGCTALSSITLPASVTRIGDYAFRGCTGLTSINIPDNVTDIGNYAFRGCTGLTSINIPDSVTDIGRSAFEGCTGLTTIQIPDSVTNIDDSAFYECTGITSATLPDGIRGIARFLFGGCTNLRSINIPKNVTMIGTDSFRGCPLSSVTLPDGMLNIGDDAFAGCKELRAITIPASVNFIHSTAFTNCTQLTIYAPAGSYAESYANSHNIPFEAITP